MREEVDFIYFVNSGKERIRLFPNSQKPLLFPDVPQAISVCPENTYIFWHEIVMQASATEGSERIPNCFAPLCADHSKDTACEP